VATHENLAPIVRRLPLRRRHVAAAVAGSAALAVAFATPQLLGRNVGQAFGRLDDASRAWLLFAGLAFLAMLTCTAAAWWSALRACGARVGLGHVLACYGTGSLVNTLLPLRIGDAVRIGLFARTLPNDGRLWLAGGAFGAIGAARALALVVVVLAAGATGSLAVWPAACTAAVAFAGIAAAVSVRNRRPSGRAGHLLAAFRALARRPRAAVALCLWIGTATAARVAAAAAASAAVGIGQPLSAALVVVLALDLAGTLPLTPGNLGVTSGAVALALQSRGIGMTTALTSGLAFHAAETAIGLLFGVCGALALAPETLRRTVLRLAVAGASVAAVAAFGASGLAGLA
jgi:uncharacterized membrane protein YbhN (UPF0104 family)